MFFLWKSSQTLVKYFPEVLLCSVRLACQFYFIVTHSLGPISSHSSSKFLVKYLQAGFTLYICLLWNLKRKFIDNLKSILWNWLFSTYSIVSVILQHKSDTIYTWDTPRCFSNVRKGKMPKVQHDYWEENLKKIDFHIWKNTLSQIDFFWLFIYFTSHPLPSPPYKALPNTLPSLSPLRKVRLPAPPTPHPPKVSPHPGTSSNCRTRWPS